MQSTSCFVLRTSQVFGRGEMRGTNLHVDAGTVLIDPLGSLHVDAVASNPLGAYVW